MNVEQAFLRSVKSAAVLMIKNAELVDRRLLPQEFIEVIERQEQGRWHGLPAHEKLVMIENLVKIVDGKDRASQFFDAYPHPWTRGRFATFRKNLTAYHQVLMQETTSR